MNDLLQLFMQADKAGLKWYAEAHDECQKLADELGLELWKVVAILAILSPKCPWNKNIEYTKAVITGKPCGALGPNVKKAERLLAGAPLTDCLRGPKVTSFYYNILRRGYDTNVTIDVHIRRLFTGKAGNVHKALYKQITNQILILASIIRLPPAKVQAILWVYSRGLTSQEHFGIMKPYTERFEEGVNND